MTEVEQFKLAIYCFLAMSLLLLFVFLYAVHLTSKMMDESGKAANRIFGQKPREEERDGRED